MLPCPWARIPLGAHTAPNTSLQALAAYWQKEIERESHFKIACSEFEELETQDKPLHEVVNLQPNDDSNSISQGTFSSQFLVPFSEFSTNSVMPLKDMWSFSWCTEQMTYFYQVFQSNSDISKCKMNLRQIAGINRESGIFPSTLKVRIFCRWKLENLERLDKTFPFRKLY